MLPFLLRFHLRHRAPSPTQQCSIVTLSLKAVSIVRLVSPRDGHVMGSLVAAMMEMTAAKMAKESEKVNKSTFFGSLITQMNLITDFLKVSI